ncbi:PKAR [Symbiodinium microadriaticum]|nr:PKAR [Symbiodinium microadriaticum]
MSIAAKCDVVIEQGDEGHELFVIRSGICSVQVNGHEVAQLKDGDYFGENALLRAEPRNATIVAKLGCIRVKRNRQKSKKQSPTALVRIEHCRGLNILQCSARVHPGLGSVVFVSCRSSSCEKLCSDRMSSLSTA